MPERIIAVYEITATIVVRETLPPVAPVIASNAFSIIFTKGPNMAQRTGTIQLGGTVDPTVTSIPVTIAGSTAGPNPVVVDAFVAPGGTPNTFLANDGDILSETAVQINPTGSSPASVAIEIVVGPGVVLPGPPIGVLPIAPVLASNTFV
jgi:hypothetical protein